MRLLELIDEADIFQLFWSSNSMRSEYVRREWEHALALGRPRIHPSHLLGGADAAVHQPPVASRRARQTALPRFLRGGGRTRTLRVLDLQRYHSVTMRSGPAAERSRRRSAPRVRRVHAPSRREVGPARVRRVRPPSRPEAGPTRVRRVHPPSRRDVSPHAGSPSPAPSSQNAPSLADCCCLGRPRGTGSGVPAPRLMPASDVGTPPARFSEP